MHLSNDRGRTFRRTMMPCGKVRVRCMDVPDAPDERLRQVQLYRSMCCGIEAEQSDDPMCPRCGADVVVRVACPSEALDERLSSYYEYDQSLRREKKSEDGKAGEYGKEKKNAFQNVPMKKEAVFTDLLNKLKHQTDVYLPHYYSYTMEDLAMKSHDYTFGRDTIKLSTDFAAQISHEFTNNITCTQFNNSNCEVNVVAFNPRWVKDEETGKLVRALDVHVWFAIGPTTSKFKEADSHFHNVVLSKIIDYYKVFLPEHFRTELRFVLICTDGCKGQYKGRFNFKRIAEYAKTKGVAVLHAFAATAHFKGFHDALGKMISQILKNGDL
jgi:hypothetical protein